MWFKCSRVKYLNAKSLILGRQQTLYCATKKWDCSEKDWYFYALGKVGNIIITLWQESRHCLKVVFNFLNIDIHWILPWCTPAVIQRKKENRFGTFPYRDQYFFSDPLVENPSHMKSANFKRECKEQSFRKI